jgi:putative metallohydrolase (TIGR04338 family)
MPDMGGESGSNGHDRDVRHCMPRDLQSLAYLAETAVMATAIPSAAAVQFLRPAARDARPRDHDGRPAISVSRCRQYVRHVVSTCGLAIGRVPVTGGRGPRSYYGTISIFGQEIREIKIVARHRLTAHECEWTILHELAHLLSDGSRADPAAHGRHWRYHYCTLVGQVVGADAATALSHAFASRGLTGSE